MQHVVWNSIFGSTEFELYRLKNCQKHWHVAFVLFHMGPHLQPHYPFVFTDKWMVARHSHYFNIWDLLFWMDSSNTRKPPNEGSKYKAEEMAEPTQLLLLKHVEHLSSTKLVQSFSLMRFKWHARFWNIDNNDVSGCLWVPSATDALHHICEPFKLSYDAIQQDEKSNNREKFRGNVITIFSSSIMRESY